MKKILFAILFLASLTTGCSSAESRADKRNDEYLEREEAFEEGYDAGYKDGLHDGKSEMNSAMEELGFEINSMEEEWSFYRTNAVCIDIGESVYHGYYCWDFDAENYYIFNVEYAEYQGYTPCPNCFTN